MMKIQLLALMLTCSLVGCATGGARNDENRDRLRSAVSGKSIIAAMYLGTEKVSYMEEGFLHEKRKASAFTAIWDADRDLSGRLTGAMRAVGSNASSLYESTDSEVAKRFVSDAVAQLPRQSGTFDYSTQMRENEEYKKAFAVSPGVITEELSVKLRANGADVLIEVIVPVIFSFDAVMQSPKMVTNAYIRVTDLQTMQPIYRGTSGVIHPFSTSGYDNVKEATEANDLAQLKSFLGKISDQLLTQLVVKPI